jgi:hypothetical protein
MPSSGAEHGGPGARGQDGRRQTDIESTCQLAFLRAVKFLETRPGP